MGGWGALPGLLFLLHALALQQGAQQQLHSVLVLHWDIMCCTNRANANQDGHSNFGTIGEGVQWIIHISFAFVEA